MKSFDQWIEQTSLSHPGTLVCHTFFGALVFALIVESLQLILHTAHETTTLKPHLNLFAAICSVSVQLLSCNMIMSECPLLFIFWSRFSSSSSHSENLIAFRSLQEVIRIWSSNWSDANWLGANWLEANWLQTNNFRSVSHWSEWCLPVCTSRAYRPNHLAETS